MLESVHTATRSGGAESPRASRFAIIPYIAATLLGDVPAQPMCLTGSVINVVHRKRRLHLTSIEFLGSKSGQHHDTATRS